MKAAKSMSPFFMLSARRGGNDHLLLSLWESVNISSVKMPVFEEFYDFV